MIEEPFFGSASPQRHGDSIRHDFVFAAPHFPTMMDSHTSISDLSAD
jgi:hypothetical protein